MKRRDVEDLFCESSSDETSPSEDAELPVNEEYARRFEHNKRRTELHRLQAKHPEAAARTEAREIAATAGLDSGDDSSSSDEERGEERLQDEGELAPEEERRWAQALLKIRTRDATLYDHSTRLFDSPSGSSEGLGGEDGGGEDSTYGDKGLAEVDGSDHGGNQTRKQQKKHKRQTLREVLFEQAVQGAIGTDEEEGGDAAEEQGTEGDRKRRLRADRVAEELAYNAEQHSLRASFLQELNRSEGGGLGSGSGSEDEGEGGLTLRRRSSPVHGNREPVLEDQQDVNAALDAFFGTASAEHDGASDAFLQTFLRRRLWAQEGDDAGDSGGVAFHGSSGGARVGEDGCGAPSTTDAGVVPDVEEDQEFLEQADDFERVYNFRSEEPGGTAIATYPRRVEGLVRREDSARKRQREARQARAEAAAQERTEEIKRLKNLKRREVSGSAAPDATVLNTLLDADFDPDKWDEVMASAFGDGYYAEQEEEAAVRSGAADVAAGITDWNSREGGSAAGATQTFAAVHQRVTGRDGEELLPETDYGDGQKLTGRVRRVPGAGRHGSSEDSEGGGSSNREGDEGTVALGPGGSEQMVASKQQVHAALEEYFQLDCEDEVGGVRTRFRYRSVPPIRDGLSATEVLALTDKELNSIVGLRKLAPFLEDTERIRPNYKALSAARKRLEEEGLLVDKAASRRLKSEAQRGRDARSGRDGSRKQAAIGKDNGVGLTVSAARSGGVSKKHGDGKAKKRPGPALRRALKAAADAASTGDTVGPATAPDGVAASPKAVVELAGAAASRAAKRWALMSESDKQQLRLQSYNKPQLPGKSGGKASMSSSRSAAVASTASRVVPADSAAALPKAARKNLKRKLKRQGNQEPVE